MLWLRSVHEVSSAAFICVSHHRSRKKTRRYEAPHTNIILWQTWVKLCQPCVTLWRFLLYGDKSMQLIVVVIVIYLFELLQKLFHAIASKYKERKFVIFLCVSLHVVCMDVWMHRIYIFIYLFWSLLLLFEPRIACRHVINTIASLIGTKKQSFNSRFSTPFFFLFSSGYPLFRYIQYIPLIFHLHSTGNTNYHYLTMYTHTHTHTHTHTFHWYPQLSPPFYSVTMYTPLALVPIPTIAFVHTHMKISLPLSKQTAILRSKGVDAGSPAASPSSTSKLGGFFAGLKDGIKKASQSASDGLKSKSNSICQPKYICSSIRPMAFLRLQKSDVQRPQHDPQHRVPLPRTYSRHLQISNRLCYQMNIRKINQVLLKKSETNKESSQ